jgi:hypothetical protein
VFGSLTSRLTLIFLGVTVALVVVLRIGEALSTIDTFSRDVNGSAAQALAAAAQELGAERRAGRSLADAAKFASDRLDRPNLRLTVLNFGNRTVFGSQPRDWRDRLATINLRLFGTQTASRGIEGGILSVGPNAVPLVDALTLGLTRTLPFLLGAVVVAAVLAQFISGRTIAPLREVTTGLRSMVHGDFAPKPVASSTSARSPRPTKRPPSASKTSLPNATPPPETFGTSSPTPVTNSRHPSP